MFGCLGEDLHANDTTPYLHCRSKDWRIASCPERLVPAERSEAGDPGGCARFPLSTMHALSTVEVLRHSRAAYDTVINVSTCGRMPHGQRRRFSYWTWPLPARVRRSLRGAEKTKNRPVSSCRSRPVSRLQTKTFAAGATAVRGGAASPRCMSSNMIPAQRRRQKYCSSSLHTVKNSPSTFRSGGKTFNWSSPHSTCTTRNLTVFMSFTTYAVLYN